MLFWLYGLGACYNFVWFFVVHIVVENLEFHHFILVEVYRELFAYSSQSAPDIFNLNTKLQSQNCLFQLFTMM